MSLQGSQRDETPLALGRALYSTLKSNEYHPECDSVFRMVLTAGRRYSIIGLGPAMCGPVHVRASEFEWVVAAPEIQAPEL